MKRILMAVIVSMLSCSFGFAQQNPSDAPATKEDVENYLQAVHSHDMIKQMMEAMSQPMHKMVHDEYEKDKDKLPPDFEARMNKMMDEMLQGMPWDDIMQSMVPIYQKHFTKSEIAALTVFYASPVGQKVLREMPGVMADSMNTMMPIVQKHMQEVTQHVEDEIAKAEKQSTKAPASK